VIAVVFILLLLGIFLGLSLFGMAGADALPVGPILVVLAIFCGFFAAGIYIGAALGVLGILTGFAFSDRPFWTFLGQTVWGPSSSFVLVSVPLFLLMGEILLRAGLSERLYRALNVWLDRMPGGLLHTNIVASGVFSAISGSSVATAAAMGSVAMPFFQNRGYDPRMVMGSLAAGGALGNLIPPGSTFIIYALITETSVGALYIAALGPALLVVALFIGVILLKRRAAPPPGEPVPLREKLRALVGLIPTILLILVVLGTI
jgi:C4-dicarboxylate transporter DctM subunit